MRGVCDGWLMCETRNAARASRESEDGDDGDDSSRRAPRRRQGGSRRNVKPRGSGPREGGNGNGFLLAELLAEKGFSHYCRNA